MCVHVCECMCMLACMCGCVCVCDIYLCELFVKHTSGSYPTVQVGPPYLAALHSPHLPVMLGQVIAFLDLQVVDPSRLHAVSGPAHRGAVAQAAAHQFLCGLQPQSHKAGLGEGAVWGVLGMVGGPGKSIQIGRVSCRERV